MDRSHIARKDSLAALAMQALIGAGETDPTLAAAKAHDFADAMERERASRVQKHRQATGIAQGGIDALDGW
jgi:hypothetical protein